jgi:hypothetical protein
MEQPSWYTREKERLEREAEKEKHDLNERVESYAGERLARSQPAVEKSLPEGVTIVGQVWRLPKKPMPGSPYTSYIGFELAFAPGVEVTLIEVPDPDQYSTRKGLALYYGNRRLARVDVYTSFENLTSFTLIPALLKAYRALTAPRKRKQG